MTVQLTKAQIDAIKVELAKVGLSVTVARKATRRSDLSRLRAWKPETPAGRKCKSSLLKWAAIPQVQGARDYKVRDWRGNWLSEGHPKFEKARTYQRYITSKGNQDGCYR
jgi:hypothetical protein